MKHALVTGGAGFIGSHLVDRLLTDGWWVTTLDNFDDFYPREVKEQNVASHRLHPRFRLVEADIRDSHGLQAKLGDAIDVVVHLAARAGVRPSIQHPDLYQDVNVTGTQRLLEFTKHRRIRQFVFASSSSVYGINPNVPWREDEPVLRPISPYASTKVSGELMGHVYSHLYATRFIALRFFTAYGPRQRPDLAIHRFARRMLRNEELELFGDGASQRDYTYIADIVEGVRAAMEYTATSYEVINLGNQHAVALAEVVSNLEDALGLKAKVVYLPEQPGDVPQTCADTAKARALLGYEPRTRFETGIRSFTTWLTDGHGGSSRHLEPGHMEKVVRLDVPPTAVGGGV